MPNMTENLDTQAYDKWVSMHRTEMAVLFDPAAAPTLKTVLFLALLDAGTEDSGYRELEDRMIDRGVIAKNKVRSDSLRVAMRELTQLIHKRPSPYSVARFQRGTQSRFRLEHGGGALLGAAAESGEQGETFVTCFAFDHPKLQADAWERYFGNHFALPPYLPFCLPESAARWIASANASVSDNDKAETVESNETFFESTSWRRLGIKAQLLDAAADNSSSRVIAVVGLAVGEGHGEIALLEQVLEDLSADKHVHYLAVDLSHVFLASHAHRLRVKFAKEIAEGRLLCAAVVGDVADLAVTPTSLPRHPVAVARRATGLGENFLPRDSPMLMTYLGNNLGDVPDPSEWLHILLLRILKNRLGDGCPGETRSTGTSILLVGISFEEVGDEATSEADESGAGKSKDIWKNVLSDAAVGDEATSEADESGAGKSKDIWKNVLSDAAKALGDTEWRELVPEKPIVETRRYTTWTKKGLDQARVVYSMGLVRIFFITRYGRGGLIGIRELIDAAPGLELIPVADERKDDVIEGMLYVSKVPTITGPRTCGLFAVKTHVKPEETAEPQDSGGNRAQ